MIDTGGHELSTMQCDHDNSAHRRKSYKKETLHLQKHSTRVLILHMEQVARSQKPSIKHSAGIHSVFIRIICTLCVLQLFLRGG